MLQRLKYLVQDPPPPLVFEISERSVTAVRRHSRGLDVEAKAERELAEGTILSSPGKQNVQLPDELEQAVESLFHELGPAKRPDAALLLPDACARLTTLDFDQLPGDGKERLELIRLRLKKTLPFDVELARIAYQAQRTTAGWALLVAVTLPEVVKQYESPLQKVGLETGFVAVSAASALNLVPTDGMVLFVKLAARSLTIAAVEKGVVRMVRSVELAPDADLSSSVGLEEMTADLFPTTVFVADNLGAPVAKVVLCGFDQLLPSAVPYFSSELGVDVEPLRSPDGVIEGQEAGIWGYLSTQ